MRLIDADALELEPDPWGGMNGCICVGRSGGKTMAIVQGMLKHMIKKAPTIDAVPVVRCGLCRYCDTKDCPMSGTPGSVSVSDFCSYGERRIDV